MPTIWTRHGLSSQHRCAFFFLKSISISIFPNSNLGNCTANITMHQSRACPVILYNVNLQVTETFTQTKVYTWARGHARSSGSGLKSPNKKLFNDVCTAASHFAHGILTPLDIFAGRRIQLLVARPSRSTAIQICQMRGVASFPMEVLWNMLLSDVIAGWERGRVKLLLGNLQSFQALHGLQKVFEVCNQRFCLQEQMNSLPRHLMRWPECVFF